MRLNLVQKKQPGAFNFGSSNKIPDVHHKAVMQCLEVIVKFYGVN